jgi:hypothetical protein
MSVRKGPKAGQLAYKPGTPVIPALGRLRQKDPEFKTSLGYRARLYLKEKAGGVARMVEHLPIKHEA